MTAHQFSEKRTELINLQQYVTKVKKVPEREAILIFYDIVRVVANLHKVIEQNNYISFILLFIKVSSPYIVIKHQRVGNALAEGSVTVA